MSTRIYKGFRLNTDSFTEALRIVDSFRPWVLSQADALHDSFIENLCTTGRTMREARDAWLDLRAAIRKEGGRVPAADTDFSISLIPAGGTLLGIVFTEQAAWHNAWIALPEVAEFGYWDNADGPDDVPEEQWVARGKAWDVLNATPVAVQSFSIDLVPPQGPMPKVYRTT